MPIILWWGAGLLLSGFGLKLVNDEAESMIKTAFILFGAWWLLKRMKVI